MGDDRGTGGGAPPEGIGGAGGRGSGAASLLTAGQVVAGQFEVVRPLGRGGMGVVYEVRDGVTGDHLALKTILPVHLGNPKAVRRFIEEINAARRLHHPNIIAVFDVGQDKENPSASLFFTMEYLEGQSVRKLIEKRGRFDLAETAAILTQLCDALEYAHEFMIHRDLSPENVMVLEDGTVRLLDFGLARMLNRATMTATGAALGKAHYMSPEQRKSAAHVDKRTDIYALGVMLYEILTGKLPHGMESLADLRPDLPPEVDRLVGRCLCRVEQRIESAGAFRAALRQGLEAHRARHTPAPASMTPRVPTLPAEGGSPPSTAAEQSPERPYQPGFVLDASDIMESILAPSVPEPVRVKRTGPLGRASGMLGGWMKPLVLGALALGAVMVAGSIGMHLVPARLTDAGADQDVAGSETLEGAEAQFQSPIGPNGKPLDNLRSIPSAQSARSAKGRPFTGRRWNLYNIDAGKSMEQSVVFNPDGTLSFSHADGKVYPGTWRFDAQGDGLTFHSEFPYRNDHAVQVDAVFQAVGYDGANKMWGYARYRSSSGQSDCKWRATAN